MSNNFDHEAWCAAWRTRCCPPDRVLWAGSASAELAAHLESCPWCRLDASQPMVEAPLPALPIIDATTVSPRAGELWAVKPELGGWGEKSRYYNPPLVLVVDDRHERMVSVLQVYDDANFAGPGDVPMLPVTEGFVESWNMYSLCKEDLALPLGTVTPEILAACRATASTPAADIEPGSLLWFFRNMEVETGFFFARKAIAKALSAEGTEQETIEVHQQLEPEPPEERRPLDIVSQLRRLSLHYEGPVGSAGELSEILCRTTLPDDRLPLAAADLRQMVQSLVFTIEGDQVTECAVRRFEVNIAEMKDSVLLISGILRDEPFVYDEFFCRWQTPARLLSPIPGQFGCEDGTVWATFEGEGLDLGRERSSLILRFVTYR